MSLGSADSGTLSALALLGKTAGVLALIVGLILLLAYLVNRYALRRGSAGQGRLRLIASLAIGQRERIVLVQVEDTWLVVGVANGHIAKLHELPAGVVDTTKPASGDFADRLGAALHQLSAPPR